MRKILIGLVLLSFFSCDDNKTISATEQRLVFTSTIYNEFQKADEYRQFHIAIIDSCEYLCSNYGYNNGVMTHKGNCKFCIIRNKKL